MRWPVISIPALSALLLLPVWSGVTVAAHSYGGMDLCTTYPEKMPPGIIEASQLLNPSSTGVVLMQKYCEQCHYLPGPGRHTASEWPVLLKQMNLLMDVSNRFGNLMGKIETPTESEREIIRDYLVSNALQPLEPIPEAIKGDAYERHCGSCHALPDPKQHTPAEWPQVIQRMLRSMPVMKYSPPDGAELKAIEDYLINGISIHQPAIESTGATPAESKPSKSVAEANSQTDSITGSGSGGQIMALGPFVLLVLIGMWRWFFNSKRKEQ